MPEICVKCSVAYRTEKQGIVVNELAEFGSYRLWLADLKECPECGSQIIAGFAQENFSEHIRPEHNEIIEKAKADGVLYEWRGWRSG